MDECTEAEVGRILSAALERFIAELERFVGEAHRPKVYSLPEVAEMTHVGERWLWDQCRTGRVQHVHHEKKRGMTVAQIRALLDQHSEGGNTVPAPTELSAVQMSRRNAARTGRRKTA